MLSPQRVTQHRRPVCRVRGAGQIQYAIPPCSEQPLLPCDVTGREAGSKHGRCGMQLPEEIDQGPHNEFQRLPRDIFQFPKRADGAIDLPRQHGVLDCPSLFFTADAGHVDHVLSFNRPILADQCGEFAEFRVKLGEVQSDPSDQQRCGFFVNLGAVCLAGPSLAPGHCERCIGGFVQIDLVHQSVGLHQLVDLSCLPSFGSEQQGGRFDWCLDIRLEQLACPTRPLGTGTVRQEPISLIHDDDLVFLQQAVAPQFIEHGRRFDRIAIEVETFHCAVGGFQRFNQAAGVHLHQEGVLPAQDDRPHVGRELRRAVGCSTSHLQMVVAGGDSVNPPQWDAASYHMPMLLLQVIEGPDQGRVLPLPEDEPQLIGRSSEALPSTDTSISRRHAELTPDDGIWHVRDLESANGTFVNGELISDRVALQPGDEVRCGGSCFRLIDAQRDVGGPIGLLEQERLASVGQTVASISHAIKNILQGLRGGASAIELAIDRGDLELAREGWPILSRNLDRIYDLTFNMLTFARSRGIQPELQPLMPLLEEVVTLIRPLAERRRVHLELALDSTAPPVQFDGNAMHQAMLNLLLNAVEAVSSKSGLVRLRAAWDADRGSTSIVVEDNGPGIESERYEEVFRPFSSTKGQRGTGLGLPVTRQLIEDHGGTIDLGPSELGGACFRIELPGHGPEDPGETTGPRPMEAPPDHDLEFDR